MSEEIKTLNAAMLTPFLPQLLTSKVVNTDIDTLTENGIYVPETGSTGTFPKGISYGMIIVLNRYDVKFQIFIALATSFIALRRIVNGAPEAWRIFEPTTTT